MSRFIEIKPGISVRSDEVEGILDFTDESNDAVKSKVYTHHNEYPSIFDRATLVLLIEGSDEQEVPTVEGQHEVLNIMKEIGVPAW